MANCDSGIGVNFIATTKSSDAKLRFFTKEGKP
jgi:hypothetical protein